MLNAHNGSRANGKNRPDTISTKDLKTNLGPYAYKSLNAKNPTAISISENTTIPPSKAGTRITMVE